MFVNLIILSFGELLRKYVYNFRNRLETNKCKCYYSWYLFVSFSNSVWHMGLVAWHLVTIARTSFCVYYCVLSIFFNINLYNICIFCKLLYGLCFQNKHIMNTVRPSVSQSVRPSVVCRFFLPDTIIQLHRSISKSQLLVYFNQNLTY